MVETYTRLLPDKQDEIITLLRTIATQNYTTSNGLINSTSPVPEIDLDVPEWVPRVNGLWFASLIMSLATASLGMLVKSWLREYLALNTEAPIERLRAHYYREPAMKTWLVYEIVGMLPLMLQIALGLFFVGLCFFTAALDNSMRLTSLPLVMAWAFFLFITTILPVFFPRCPYKVHSLRWFIWALRRTVKKGTSAVRKAVSDALLETIATRVN